MTRDHDLWYSSAEYAEKLKAAQQQERNRQDLCAGRATKGALAYARFLTACESAVNTPTPKEVENGT